VALALVAGSVFLYRDLGAPGYSDLPLDFRKQMAELRAESRPSQAEAEAQIPAAPAPEAEASYLELVAQLRATAAKRENDAQGQALLAQHEANLGNFKAAYEAKQRYIDIMAGDLGPQDFSELSELMIMAAGGYVSPEAEEALEQALTLDGRHGPSLYYMGLTLRQIGRPDVAFAVWKDAYERGPAEAPWVKAIGPQLEDLAYQAGVKYQLPAPQSLPASAAPGPSAEDVQAAQEMSEGDRQEMIRGMVNGLSQRLAEEGGTPEEWARLIGALGVLGEGARAEAIYTEAGQKFAGNEAALALLAQAAQQAGIAQ
jgi:cytochrome c-type biogenesis protein CcmH